jgi:hypothetical protein
LVFLFCRVSAKSATLKDAVREVPGSRRYFLSHHYATA